MNRIAVLAWVLAFASANQAGARAATPEAEPWKEVWRITTDWPWLRSPAVTDGKAIVGTGHDVLTALELNTGEVVWATKVRSAFQGAIVIDGVAYIGGSDNDMHAVNVRDGKLLWSYQAFTPWEGDGFMKGRPSHGVKALGVEEGCALFSSSDGNVYGISLADGKKAWQLGSPPGWSRCLSGGVLYLLGKDDKVFAVDARTRGTLWAKERTTVHRFPYRFGGAVFMAGEGRVAALSARDGTQLWVTDTPRKARMMAPLQAVGDALIVLGEWDDDTVYGLHRETGKILWQARVTGYPRSSALWGEDKLLASTNAGMVSAINARTGHVLAERPLGVTGMEAPTVAGGLILVPSQEPVEGKPHGRGVLTAYRLDAGG